MDKATKAKIGLTAASIFLAAGGATAVIAAEGGGGPEDKFLNKAAHAEIQQAVEDGDYDSWAALSLERNAKMKEEADAKVTPETFEILQEINQLIEDGNKEEAMELREELGFGPGHDAKMGKMMHGQKAGEGKFAEQHEEMKTALESGDYDAWVELMSQRPGDHMEDSINEETFQNMIEVHELMEEGGREGARELREEMGFGQGAHGLGHQMR